MSGLIFIQAGDLLPTLTNSIAMKKILLLVSTAITALALSNCTVDAPAAAGSSAGAAFGKAAN